MPRDYTYTENLSAMSEELATDLELLGGRVERVVSRTLKKLSRWIRTHSVREIGEELNISQKALKRRFLVSSNTGGESPSISIWFGLLNVAANQMGTPRQNGSGTRVGKHQFDGAFVQRIYGSDERVYIRTSRNASAGHATVSQKPGRSNPNPDRVFLNAEQGRFPVQVVGVEIEEVALDIMRRYEIRINARYQVLLKQELNFALNVE